MNKKKIMGGVLAAAITFGATLSGCSLVSTNAETNLKQTVAEVNISLSEDYTKTLEDEGLSSFSDVVTTAEVSRRDLIAYFLNVGYSYVQSGYSYETVFNMLIESLTETEALAQYATMYLLEAISEKSGNTVSGVLDAYNSCKTEQEQYIYLLTETQDMGSQVNRVNLATYSLYYSINSSIDSYEEEYIKADDDDDTSGSDSRTTPTGVDTEIDDYYPADENGKLNYGIYTGYTNYTIEKSGAYEDDRLDGDTRTLRTYAYNDFIKSLKANYLIGDNEDCSDVLSLSYIQEEYTNQLKSQVIEMYYDIYETDLEEVISDPDSGYIATRYNELLTQQTVTYKDTDTFESALDSMASDSFVLYAPGTTSTGSGTFGFVYNILLPFSQSQSNTLAHYSDLLENGSITDEEYYNQRNKLLQNITTTDQRSAWITGTTDYSFDASETDLEYYNGGDSTRTYLFFENNLLKNDRYEELENYIGSYSFNGTVTEADDGSYILTLNKLTIDDMLGEFVGYVNYVLDDTSAASYTKVDNYYQTYTVEAQNLYETDSNEIDYTNFIYATGKVTIDSNKISNLFVKDSTQYKALSAVNELQYAYTTDTSVLSQYIGYSVSAYDTSYIKEFETAAKAAIEEGAGTFYVLAGDYGWHIIYVTATFDNNGGEVYGDVNWSNITEIGSFENLFYEYIKESDLDSATTNRRSQLIALFVDDSSVVLYEDAYSDLLELDS